jgi:hypothetical protein
MPHRDGYSDQRESMNPRVLARLQTRFQLQSTAGQSRTWLDPTIWPVTDADALLRSADQQTDTTATIPAGDNGNYQIFTVPRGQRWHIYSFDLYINSGDNRIERLVLGDSTPTVATIVRQSAATTLTYVSPGTPFPIDELGGIWVGMSGAGSSGSVVGADIWIQSEDAY